MISNLQQQSEHVILKDAITQALQQLQPIPYAKDYLKHPQLFRLTVYYTGSSTQN